MPQRHRRALGVSGCTGRRGCELVVAYRDCGRIVAMSSEASSRRQRAQLENYRTDENLRRRASLFEYVVPSASPQPMLWDLFPWSNGQTLLDLGCGNGMWSGALAGRVPHGFVVGLDVSTGMLAALGERHPSVPRVCADGQVLPLRDDAVDGVLAAWMLYHVPDKRAILDEVRRVMRAGGSFIGDELPGRHPPTR
jgi:SAM-dependent methyltransferase